MNSNGSPMDITPVVSPRNLYIPPRSSDSVRPLVRSASFNEDISMKEVKEGDYLHYSTLCSTLYVPMEDTTGGGMCDKRTGISEIILEGQSIKECFIKACIYNGGGQRALDKRVTELLRSVGKISLNDLEPKEWESYISTSWSSKQNKDIRISTTMAIVYQRFISDVGFRKALYTDKQIRHYPIRDIGIYINSLRTTMQYRINH